MSSKKCVLSVAAALVLMCGAAAHGEIGPYAGVSVGQSRVDVSLQDVGGADFSIDDDDFAWKVYFGVELAGPLAIEGGYRDLGQITDGTEVLQVSAESDGLDLFAVALLPLGPVALFAKGGIIAWDSEVETSSAPGLGIPNLRLSDSGTDPAWGVGIKFEVGKFAVRGEFERFEVDLPDDLSMLSVGISYEF